MKPVDRRKSIADLRRMLRKKGIDVEVVPGRGKGSHEGLVFVDRDSGRKVSVIIAGKHDISPGVQRDILTWARESVEVAKASGGFVALYEIISDALASIFGGGN